MSSKRFIGSFCLTDIIAAAKSSHSAFNKSEKNGKIYFNVVMWENEDPGRFGQTHSVQLQSTKEKSEAEGRIYIGNLKAAETQGQQPITQKDLETYDDIPF